MKPVASISLRPEDFGSGGLACLGWQVAEVIRAIDSACPGLSWYVADVQTVGYQFPFRRRPTPEQVGDSTALENAARMVEQFESGVFVGVPAAIEAPRWRSGGLYTDDEERAELGDALVEVRAFDTTSVTIACSDDVLLVRAFDNLKRRDPSTEPWK